MSQNKIESLTPEQEALIPVYREKWRKLVNSTQPIDRDKAAEILKRTYTAIGKPEPEIRFFDSPIAALNELMKICDTQPGQDSELYLNANTVFSFYYNFTAAIARQTTYFESLSPITLSLTIRLIIFNILSHQSLLIKQIQEGGLKDFLQNRDFFAATKSIVTVGCTIDYCLKVLECDGDLHLLNLFLEIFQECGWIFPYEKLCLVCDRPRILSTDRNNELHAEGKPAMQFADSYSLYVHHGVRLPEKYGKLHPCQWQAQWLLQEKNAEIRRVLIEGIGYGRICQELQGKELDRWREYSLLKIEKADIEPICLLTMTCPSTQRIHALRVPPELRSAREAICWVNWGVDPEEFAVET